MAENNAEKNFITEKIWEPLLTETLCFYWGCPNIEQHIDPRCYIVLDLDNFEQSFQTIKNSVLNNEWEKRLPYIKAEKQRVLDYFNFFPTVERVLQKEYRLSSGMSNQEVLYHKYFNKLLGQSVNKVCFLHCCVLGKTSVLDRYIQKFRDSGLTETVDYIFIVNLGDQITEEYGDKIIIINYSPNVELYEFPTLKLLHTFSYFNQSAKVLYLHTKGVTHQGEILLKVQDRADYMSYFLMDNHKTCLDLLDEYDTVGCNLLSEPYKHYSGNFWWAQASYIATLQAPVNTADRHQAEWWICRNLNGEHFSISNSNINHYQSFYPKHLYSLSQIHDNISEFVCKLNHRFSLSGLSETIYKFDPKTRIKCINLERRPDRKQQIEKLLTKTNLSQHCDFFKAIDGKSLTATPEIKKLFSGNDFGNRKSFIGCALSHYTLWQELVKDDDYENYLILEDDIEFSDKNIHVTLHKVYELMSSVDWDIVYLGHHIHRNCRESYNNKYQSQKKTVLIRHLSNITVGGLFGYILNKSGAQKFINFIEKNGIKHGIDYLMFHYEKEIGIQNYEVVPKLILSEYVDNNNLVDSDIQYLHDPLF